MEQTEELIEKCESKTNQEIDSLFVRENSPATENHYFFSEIQKSRGSSIIAKLQTLQARKAMFPAIQSWK